MCTSFSGLSIETFTAVIEAIKGRINVRITGFGFLPEEITTQFEVGLLFSVNSARAFSLDVLSPYTANVYCKCFL